MISVFILSLLVAGGAADTAVTAAVAAGATAAAAALSVSICGLFGTFAACTGAAGVIATIWISVSFLVFFRGEAAFANAASSLIHLPGLIGWRDSSFP